MANILQYCPGFIGKLAIMDDDPKNKGAPVLEATCSECGKIIRDDKEWANHPCHVRAVIEIRDHDQAWAKAHDGQYPDYS